MKEATMAEIRFNLVSRIASDKNFFGGPFNAVKRARAEGLPVHLTLIGGIHNLGLFEKLERLVITLSIEDCVTFTKRSIPFHDFTEEKKGEYFLNFSVGDFVGYSSIEGVNRGLKTMFYNIEKEYHGGKLANSYCYCQDEEALVEKFRSIDNDKQAFDAKLIEENNGLKTQYALSFEEREFLKAML